MPDTDGGVDVGAVLVAPIEPLSVGSEIFDDHVVVVVVDVVSLTDEDVVLCALDSTAERG